MSRAYCESCATPRSKEEKLYDVGGKKVCADCGKEEIKAWNRCVQEAEMDLHDPGIGA